MYEGGSPSRLAVAQGAICVPQLALVLCVYVLVMRDGDVGSSCAPAPVTYDLIYSTVTGTKVKRCNLTAYLIATCRNYMQTILL